MKKSGLCTYCGRIDQLINSLCNDCHREEMMNLKEIKAFLTKYPKSNATEVSLETGISIDKITRLIKRGSVI